MNSFIPANNFYRRLRHTYYLSRCIITLLAVLFCGVTASADTETISKNNQKVFLIINSYHEDESWSNNMILPVELEMVRVDSVRCETMFLNSSGVTSQEDYDTICENLFKKYADNPPSYLIMIGNFAFTLRERIKKEWGDIPMLVISRIDEFGPMEDHLTANTANFDSNRQQSFSVVRKDYNFTAILAPDYCREVVDLMMHVIPDMKKFVFMSDEVYINKVAVNRIKNYLAEKYPQVEFEWLRASENASDEITTKFSLRDPQTGLLLSSWVYETASTRGVHVLTAKELSLVAGSVNPVFTMRQIYLTIGAVGGVFADADEIKVEVMKVVQQMLEGKSMRDIPFYIPEEPKVAMNYLKMIEHGLDEAKCPKDTQFINKPVSYLKRYWATILVSFIVLMMMLSLLIAKNRQQKKTLNVLERHRLFVSNMPIPYTKAAIWADENNEYLKLTYELKNQAYEKLLAENGIGENRKDLFTAEFRTEKMRELLDKPGAISFTHHFESNDSYYLFMLYPVKTNRKVQTSHHAFELDIFALNLTDTYKMEKRLQEQADSLLISMDLAKFIPWRWNFETDEISFSAYNNYFRTTALNSDGENETTYTSYLSAIHPDDLQIVKKVQHQIATGETKEFKVYYRLINPKQANGIEWCENYGRVTEFDKNGKPLKLTGALQIITERKNQEEMMARALERANEADRMKSAFLANMSHEIRTPLNAIVGFSNLLASSDDPQDKLEFADVINRNNDLLLNLINDVLDLAKIESNTIDLNLDMCDIHDVVDSISKTMEMRVPENVRLNVIHYGDECISKVDSSRLAQVLINLLTNACKFTAKGSITLGYEVRESDNTLYFYVRDTGEGIAPENLERVFQRFFKINSFVQGTGLGLSISRSLVNRMGGEMGVHSPGLGKGSTFWFTIPYEPGTIDQPKEEEVYTIDTTDLANRVFEKSSDKPTVLVAEDNPSNFFLLQRLLRNRFNLVEARNGKEALDLYPRCNPDFIIMDINMPIMDGYEAVKQLRKISPTVPIIAVTAYAFASDRARILNSGFNAYVAKPISENKFFEAIDRATSNTGGVIR